MNLNMLSRLSPVALAATGVFLLCGMDVVIKHLTASNGTLAIAFGRYLFGAAAAAAIWNAAGRPRITGEMLRAHTVRGLILVCSATGFFYALSVLELAEAITLGFLAPLLIPIAAWVLLGERPRPSSLIAGAVGFSGAVIASYGGPVDAHSENRMLGIAAVVISAITYAISIAMLRGRAGKDGAPIVGLMQSLMPMLIVAGPAIALSPLPPAADLPFFALMGVLGAAGWYLLINAYARAEAQRLAPLEFTALLWASLSGYFLFSEPLRAQVYLGALLIVGACLYVEWADRKLTPAPQTPIGD